MWIALVGIYISIGNIVALIPRIAYQGKSYIQNTLIHNLHAGDFLMGVYLVVVVISDLYWSGNYYTFTIDHEWRSSVACKRFGAVALRCVSLRWQSLPSRRAKIVHDVKYDLMRRRTVWSIISLVWLISTAIAVVAAAVKTIFRRKEC